jgi:TP901 family phage tail tape measure protein
MAVTDTKYSIGVLLSLVDQLTKPLTGVQAKLQQFDKTLKNKFGKTLKQIGTDMQDVGRKLTFALTVPLTVASGLAFKKAVDFEDAFAGVRKTVEATEEEFAVLEQGFKDLALTIPLSTEELMGIGEAAGQLGIQQEHVLKFSKVMADLAATTNLTSQEAASSLARFANIMQMSMGDVDRLGATIVALGNNSATTESEIVELAMRIAGAGKLVGMSEAEVLSMSAALSSLGIRAEAGGTAFSQAFLRMKKAVAKGGKKGQIFSAVAGLNPEEFKQLFKKDALNAMLSFIGGLKKMDEEGKEIILVLDALGLDGARMADVLLRAASGTDLMNKALSIGVKAQKENLALVEEANKRYATMKSQLALLWTQIKQMAAAFGDILIPMFQKFMAVVKPVVKWLTESPPWLKKLIIALGAGLAVLGPIIFALGTLAVVVAALSLVSTPLLMTLGAIALSITAITAAVVLLLSYADDLGRFIEDWKRGLAVIRGGDLSLIKPESQAILEARAGARRIEEEDRQRLLTQKSQASVDINVKAAPGTQATVTRADATKGADLKVNSSAMAGAMGSGG